jgi:ribose 5-phosphate isomerase B
MLFLASDHAGYQMKEFIRHKLANRNVAFEDFGTFSEEPVDYPGYAHKVARAVVKYKGIGILFCGSGQGMAMAANRHKGARASVVWDKEVARETREDNDANILSLPARFIDNDTAWEIVSTFLSTTFSHEDRHKRRISQLEL